MNSSQNELAVACGKDSSSAQNELFFQEKDLKNSVGLLFKAVYLGCVSLEGSFSFNKLPLETREKVVKSSIFQVRKAFLCAYGDGDLVKDDVSDENISQYLGEINIIRSSETAIVSITNKHLTVILSPSADKLQFTIEKISFANSNADGYFAFIAKNKDFKRICVVLKSEHAYLMVKAMSQVCFCKIKSI